jgi:hypothetical protein
MLTKVTTSLAIMEYFSWPLRLIRESIPTFEGVEWATDGLGVKHGVKEEASEGPQ